MILSLRNPLYGWLLRATAAVLVPFQLVASVTPTLRPFATERSQLQLPSTLAITATANTGLNVARAPVVPVFSRPNGQLNFSADPTDKEIATARVFEEPLVPLTGTVSVEENRALAGYITEIAGRAKDFRSLEDFLVLFPDSRWTPGVQLNLGLLYRSGGYWSKAMTAFDAAWNTSKSSTEPRMAALADRAIGELVQLHARLGHMEWLDVTLKELETRDVRGTGTARLAGAKSGLWLMRNDPGEAFRCGPMALGNFYRALFPQAPVPQLVTEFRSTERGTSISEILAVGSKLGLSLQIAYREPQADILIPAITHWKVGHFSAMVSGGADGYLSRDPTFGTDTLVTKQAVDAEGSGYFIVSKGALPTGWRPVSDEEAQSVWGKGDAGPAGPPPPPGREPNSREPCGLGMADYTVGLSTVSLMISDTPMGYSPPVGPHITLKVNYNHREQAPSTNISGFGPKWSFDWSSYITAPTTADTKSFGPGGGQLTYSGFDGPTGTFDSQLLTQGQLVRTSATRYEQLHPDGSKDIFDLAEPGLNPRIFRTQFVDPHGNALAFGYDSNYRLITVTDSLGKITLLDYSLSADPSNPLSYLITKVTDPFGRFSTFGYDSLGRLERITDVIGISSEFTYGKGDFIQTLKTPYGVTQFAADDPANIRWLEITDPLGARERVEWRFTSAGLIPGSEAVAPANVVNGFLTLRNTFYWDKKAMSEGAGDYSKARLTHWLHDTQDSSTARCSVIPESTKEPLENRVWYNYPGQDAGLGAAYAGTSNKPSRITRILDDNTEQSRSFEYNDAGNVTKSTDPLGRETTYEYASNQIDLLRIKQKNGSIYDVLAESSYDLSHRLLSSRGADGQTSTYTYNPKGQLSTVTNPKNEITTFYYDPVGLANTSDLTKIGYLVGVDGPAPGLSDLTSTTFDAFGRPYVTTSPSGYAISLNYDAFDRQTKKTYPDGTFEQVIYNRLDAEWIRDRGGRWSNYTYDSLRRVTFVTDSSNRTTSYDWCSCGSLASLVDAAGNRTSWTRDLLGRVTAKVYPDGHADVYTYENTTSRLKKKTDAKGQVTNYSYFNDDMISNVTYTDASGGALIPSTPGVGYTYGSVYPRIETMTDEQGVTHYAYHPISGSPPLGAGRLASVDGPWANDTVTYTYDELGRVVSKAIDGQSNTLTTTYDTLGRTTASNSPLGMFSYVYVSTSDRVDYVSLPNGQRTNFAYYSVAGVVGTGNGDERLQRISNLSPEADMISQYDYSYDLVGRLSTSLSVNAGMAETPRLTPRYDNAGQLAAATLTSETTGEVIREYAYRYDPAGNRVLEQSGNRIDTATYNSLNQLLNRTAGGAMQFEGTVSEPSTISLGGEEVTVQASGRWRGRGIVSSGANTIPLVATDLVGNTTNKTVSVVALGDTPRTLTYDMNGNQIDDGTGRSYSYDAANRLKTITVGGNVTEFVYDGQGRRVQEKLNGFPLKRWIWCDGSQPCEERDASNAVTKRYYKEGQLNGSMALFYTTDRLGSVHELTDTDGAIRARYDYDPYGRITKVSGDLESDFGFTGFYRHQASGLNFTLHRAYDTDIGRWLNRDPIEERGGINLYAYVENDPLNYVDPLGQNPVAIRVASWSAKEVVLAGTAAWLALDAVQKESLSRKALEDLQRRIADQNLCPMPVRWDSKSTHERPDTGLIGVPDSVVSEKARDRKLSGEERRRYQKEEKIRALRNKQKRDNK